MMITWKTPVLMIFGVAFLAGVWPPDDHWLIVIGLAGLGLTLIVKD